MRGAQVDRVPRFTLTVATSADGYISRSTDEPPQAWASAEEQDLFFADVAAADWAIMGRNTHLAADRPQRRRIIFSTTSSGWQRPTQLWLDPSDFRPEDLIESVRSRHPLHNGLILGGTRVHDWFLAHDAIDRVHLTIEPVNFGSGLPMFSGSDGENPVKVVERIGLDPISDKILNPGGTRYLQWERRS